MQNRLNTQKSNFLKKGVLTHSEVTSAKKSGALGKNTISYSKEHEIAEQYQKKRYKTQAVIQKILSNCAGSWKVIKCGKEKVQKDISVGVQYFPATQKVSLTNVRMCGLKWLCPVCLEREAQEQRRLVEEMMIFMQKKGYFAHMVTFTAPHKKYDSLKDLINSMKLARKRFFGDRANVKFFSEFFDYVGHITAMEIKHSDQNGWHPHFHTIIFTKKSYSESSLFKTEKRPTFNKTSKGIIQTEHDLGVAEKMSVMWMNACSAVGLRTPDFKHGLDFKRGYDDNEQQHSGALINYALKASLSAEIALSQKKTGEFNTESLTPFEIALKADGEKTIENPNSKYSQLFYEYACATKHNSMVEPSRKLKAFLKENGFYKKLEEKKAETESHEEPPVHVFDFTDIEWNILCENYKARLKVLSLIRQDIIEQGISASNFPRTNEFLNAILGRGQGGSPPCSRLQ